jgi:GDP-mannose 6-dehydrogenase
VKVAIFGLGYVGCVSAACLAKQGHRVYGVESNPLKVGLINDGKSPVLEKDLNELIRDAVAAGLLTAGADPVAAVAEADVSLICVGTPSRENGSLDLEYVRRVAGEIGDALRDRDGFHVVAVRSTMLPGSLEEAVIPVLEKHAGKELGDGFGACVNPEFLREGSAVADYHDPPFTLIGESDPRSGDFLEELYSKIEAPIVRTEIRTAEMLKYVSNAFHALKVGFANEIGALCKSMGIDSHEVMNIFIRDDQLNISAKYLQPGFAFGGSCLPKDLRAATHRAKMLDLDLPLLNSILPSNNNHIERAFHMIRRTGKKRVGFLGLSFKAGTDDLRESPVVQLAETLIGKGYELRILDQRVALSRLVGSNKQYIEQVLPHISSMLVTDEEELMSHAEVVVIGTPSERFKPLLAKLGSDHLVIDLVGLAKGASDLNGPYEGMCW